MVAAVAVAAGVAVGAASDEIPEGGGFFGLGCKMQAFTCR